MKKKQIPQSKTKEELIPVSKKEEEREKIGHRPALLTPELKARLIKLFEKHFFIAIVVAKAGIYRQRIYEWERELEAFRTDVTHAQGKWIAQQMDLLRKYAKDKREKDWRALKYLLSIADAEYNDKKYLKEAPGSRETPTITIIINRRDLETSKQEAYKIIGESSHKEETISLLTFKEEKKEKKGEKGQKGKPGEAET